jgi:hypothetical protein
MRLAEKQPFGETRDGEPPVVVDLKACDNVARLLASQAIPRDQEDSSLPGFPPEFVGNFYLALVAVCHQTSPRGQLPLEGSVQGVHRRGWDYLFARLEDRARNDLSLLTPQVWSRLSGSALKELYHDPVLGHRLSGPELRAVLLRELGQRMLRHEWSFADQIHEHCHGRIAAGKPNLLDVLSTFAAYRDPVRKKSVFFLALMRNSGLWKYVDEAALGPPIDYHEVRGHLRLGTVRIQDAHLLNKLLSGLPVTATEDIAIRKATYDAVMRISATSGLKNPSQIHYLFWNIFRSICTRDEPQCFALKPTCTLPDRYLHLAGEPSSQCCPFSRLCSSAGAPHPICEHVFETDYY